MKLVEIVVPLALVASWFASAYAQPGYEIVESIESMVANADYVCIAKVIEYEEMEIDVFPRRFGVKFAIEERLKSPDPLTITALSLVRKFRIPAYAKVLAEWQKKGTRLLVATDWDNPDNNHVVELDTEHPKTVTADFQLLRDSESVIQLAKEVIETMPAHVKRIHTFQLAVPESLVSKMNAQQRVQLRVPADERLEKKAQAFLRSNSPRDRSVGLRAIRYFKTTHNIAAVRKLLDDPYTIEHDAEEGRYHFYKVRSDAYDTLRIWAVKTEKPALRKPIAE